MAILNIVTRLISCAWFGMALPLQAAELTTLVYHDVTAEAGREAFSVSRSMFVAQMDYLKQNGYRPVSLDFIDKVSRGKASLPEKAVLLTFDDGLRSYGEFVAPLMKIYGYPTVVSVVGAWADGSAVPDEYRGKLMTWDELRKLRDNPLVEIISHSHNLHHHAPSNPYGDFAAAGVTRRYDSQTRSYESEEKFRQRIRNDMMLTVSVFKRHLGTVPRAIAWPYGHYDQLLVEEMTRAGMRFHLTLENGPTAVSDFPRIRRIIVRNLESLAGFIEDFQYQFRAADHRVVEFSLDAFGGLTDVAQEERLSRLLDRLQYLHATTVVVSPFTADGREAFFFNRQMPVRSDILNRVLHPILHRLRIQHIYLSLPANPPVGNPDDLYTDLARMNWFSGVVFDRSADSVGEDRVRRIVSYYNPVMKFGIDGMAGPGRRYDFSITRLDAGASRADMKAAVREMKQTSTRNLVIMENADTVDNRELAARLRILRGLGIDDYGYSPDDYVTSRPSYHVVAPEMSARSPGRRER